MLTGKLGSFSKGIKETVTCEDTCKTVGYDFGFHLTEEGCNILVANTKIIPGTYSEVDEGEVCCCANSV